MPPPPVETQEEPEIGAVSPKRAFMLGFIPGVGALYNAQYKKAAIHVGVFVLIAVLRDIGPLPIHNVLQTLNYVFFFYMAFDAYHTAKKKNPGRAAKGSKPDPGAPPLHQSRTRTRRSSNR